MYIWWGGNNFDGNRPADIVLQGEAKSNMGGDSVVCGDFNNDGYGDIQAGAYNYPRYPVINGLAYLFYGNKKGVMDTTCDYIFDPEEETKFFGLSVSVGDVNNDGYTDAFISAPGTDALNGKSFLYYGPFSTIDDITFNWDTTNATTGKHTLKVEIPPVPGEKDTTDNTMTVTVEVTEPTQ